MQILKIQTEFIKLDQLLKFAGIADNGGFAKMLIMDGLVSVNGEEELRRGRKLYRDDVVTVVVNDEEIQIKIV